MTTRGRGQRRGAGQSSFDDPFGPVVGASADSAGAGDDPERGFEERGDARGPNGSDARPQSGGHERSISSDEGIAGRRSRGRRTSGDGSRSAASRGVSRGAGRRWGDSPSDGSGSADGTPSPAAVDRTDEEWASEARSVLLRQLALGPRSRHQLHRKLADREVPPAVASALLDRFEEVQLIDDAEFARMWVRTRTAAKSLTRSSIRRELAEKGIDAELTEEALLQVSDEDEHEQAYEVVRRKLRSNADLSDRAARDKEVRRLVGVLARKGYSPGAAFSIVKDVISAVGTPDG